jgi:hypothetical protein
MMHGKPNIKCKILLHGRDSGRSLVNFKRSSDISEIEEHKKKSIISIFRLEKFWKCTVSLE